MCFSKNCFDTKEWHRVRLSEEEEPALPARAAREHYARGALWLDAGSVRRVVTALRALEQGGVTFALRRAPAPARQAAI